MQRSPAGISREELSRQGGDGGQQAAVGGR
jgi:hypothetical protein